jgi:hypothetical protein
MSKDLDLSVVVETLAGPLELEDPDNGYELGKSSLGTRAVSWRKQEINAEYVEGTYLNRAVKENITEPLEVYVAGSTTYEFQTRMSVLLDAFGQLAYTITRRIGDAQEVWNCTVADYSVETSQEFLVARIGKVTANVPRLPTVVLTQVVVP